MTFKENCTDCRNSRVVDLVRELLDFDCKVSLFDPCVSAEDVRSEYGLDPLPGLAATKPFEDFDAVVLAVPHEQFRELDFSGVRASGRVLFDIKRMLPSGQADAGL